MKGIKEIVPRKVEESYKIIYPIESSVKNEFPKVGMSYSEKVTVQ